MRRPLPQTAVTMTILPRAALLLGAALALAACGGGAPGGQRGGAAPVYSAPAADACGASAYSDRIGKAHTQFDFTAGGRDVRILGPDTAMTMDYRTERLNIDTDGAGRITRIWCG